jgi:hypothetical protein
VPAKDFARTTDPTNCFASPKSPQQSIIAKQLQTNNANQTQTNFKRAIIRNKNISRFDVAVDNICSVDFCQPRDKLCYVLENLLKETNKKKVRGGNRDKEGGGNR